MNNPTPQDILELTHKLQMDLNAAAAKLVTLRSWLAAQPAPPPPNRIDCPKCGIPKHPDALPDHLANVHGDKPHG